jgi:hypothetical protein
MDDDKLFLTPSEGHPSPFEPSGRMTPVNSSFLTPIRMWSTGWTPPPPAYGGHEFGRFFTPVVSTTKADLTQAYGPPSDIIVPFAASSSNSAGAHPISTFSVGAHCTPHVVASAGFPSTTQVHVEDTTKPPAKVKMEQVATTTVKSETPKEKKGRGVTIRNPYKKTAKKPKPPPVAAVTTTAKKAPRLPATPKGGTRKVTAKSVGAAKHTQPKSIRSDKGDKPRRLSREAYLVARGGQFTTVDHYKPSPARHTRSKTHANPLSARRFERTVAGNTYYDVVPTETTPRPIMKAPPPTPHGRASTGGPKKKAVEKPRQAPSVRRLVIHSSPGSTSTSTSLSENSTASISLSIGSGLGSHVSVTSAQSFAESIVQACVEQIVPRIESLIQDTVEEVWRASK